MVRCGEANAALEIEHFDDHQPQIEGQLAWENGLSLNAFLECTARANDCHDKNQEKRTPISDLNGVTSETWEDHVH